MEVQQTKETKYTSSNQVNGHNKKQLYDQDLWDFPSLLQIHCRARELGLIVDGYLPSLSWF